MAPAMSKLPIPPRSRPLYAKGGEANHPASARQPDKSQPRPSQSEGGAKPEGNAGFLVGVRLQPDLLARLDRVIKPGQTRPQAIRELLEKHL